MPDELKDKQASAPELDQSQSAPQADDQQASAPSPAYVLKEDFDNLQSSINRMQDNFNAITAQILQSRSPASQSPQAPAVRLPTQQEIDEAIAAGDSSKLTALVDARLATLSQTFEQRLAQIEEAGTNAISNLTENTVLSSLPRYKDFKKEIDAELTKVPKSMRMNPDTHRVVHDAVVGRNIDAILRSEREKVLRENKIDPQNLPGANNIRSGGPGSGDVPSFESIFGKEALDALTSVGRTPEYEARRHGFASVNDYIKSHLDKEKLNATQH